MSTEAGQGPPPPKKQKVLACKRCRHRKQKCTEHRPCENCTQAGSECVPTESVVAKPRLEIDYVHRLEERVAELESLIPQESLDHITSRESQGRPATAPRTEAPIIQQQLNDPYLNSGYNFQPDLTQRPPQPAAQYDTPSLPTSSPLAVTSLDVSNLGLFGALSNIKNRAQPAAMHEEIQPDMPSLGYEMEQFLIQTYFDMAHSQYPMLLKHQFLKWYESWRTEREKLSTTMRWKGFFVYMVYAIAFLMTKSRINGAMRAQEFHALATTKYLPYLQASPSTLLRAQGFLLLCFYALHMPSGEDIMTLSSWTIRFCVMSQMHLAETEPEPINGDALVHIQHRRRVFWCAYAMDRAVCSSFHIPCSIPDNQITVPMFDKIDDDQLLAAASSGDILTHLIDSNAPTSTSAALHIIVSRQLESQIQEVVLRKDFTAQSEEAFRWRSEILGKLKEWNAQSVTTSEPTQKGYVSVQWLQMIYYYNVVMLFRPTKATVQGIAGDLTVQACCQALLLFRKFQMAREIAQPWLGLLTQFQLGVCLLYCFFATPPLQWKQSYKSSTVSNAIRACSSTLAILAERWDEAECLRDVFEILAREISVSETWGRPTGISEAGRSGIEKSWAGLTAVLVHRPTLLMIHEIITEDFVGATTTATRSEQPGLDDRMGCASSAAEGENGTANKEMDLQWADYTPGLLLSLDTPFDTENTAEGFSDAITFYL